MKFDSEKCAKVRGMLKKKEHLEDSEEEIIKEVNPSDQHTEDFEEEFIKEVNPPDQNTNTSESKKILE